MENNTFNLDDPANSASDDAEKKSSSNSAGKTSAAEQGLEVPMGWKPTVSEPVPVVRCHGTNREGNRCGRWSLRGAQHCVKHGGQLPNYRDHSQAVVESARLELMNMADQAVDVVNDLLIRPGVQDQIRLKAAETVLNRVGLKEAEQINVEVTHKSNADDIRERLKAISDRITKPEEDQLEDEGEIIDAEEDPRASDGS